MSSTRVRALFCDLQNLPRGKYVPQHVADGGRIGFARAVFGVSLDRDLLVVPGAGVMQGIPDVELVLDEERRQAWQENTEIALGDLHADGEAFGLCARSQLKRTITEWQAHGYTPMVGLEMEAYVFQQDADQVWRPYDTPGAFVYGTGPANDPAGLMDAIWERAHKIGLPVESMNGEYDNGQFELTMCFDEALKACDDAFLFRTMAKEEALKRGLMLSFMPKPIPDRGGSGLHVNFSFAQTSGKQKGQNAIAPDGNLSEMAQGCVAGLIRHHEGLAALLGPTVNSYARLEPASMAGYWANWAEDHRLVTLRTSTGSPKSARIEHRMADCSANPYQAVTAVLQGAKLGYEVKMPIPAAEDLDGLENVRATRHVPASLEKALDALDADKVLREAVGALYCEALMVLKRDEAQRLADKSVDEIRDFYLPFI